MLIIFDVVWRRCGGRYVLVGDQDPARQQDSEKCHASEAECLLTTQSDLGTECCMTLALSHASAFSTVRLYMNVLEHPKRTNGRGHGRRVRDCAT